VDRQVAPHGRPDLGRRGGRSSARRGSAGPTELQTAAGECLRSRAVCRRSVAVVVDYAAESWLVAEAPSQDGVETVSEVLARGDLVLHPAVADAAEALGYCAQLLAQSLGEPHTLRTPEHGRRTLGGLHDMVLSAAVSAEAVGRAVDHARARGEVEGPWTGEDADALTAAAAEFRRALPALARSAAAVGRLSYTGPGFDTQTQQLRGLVEELRRRDATVTFDPTTLEDYEESNRSGGGAWLVQFRMPQDPRTFQTIVGDTLARAADALPSELTHDDVHPALVVGYILDNLDDFATEYTVDPATRGDDPPGRIPPPTLEHR